MTNSENDERTTVDSGDGVGDGARLFARQREREITEEVERELSLSRVCGWFVNM